MLIGVFMGFKELCIRAELGIPARLLTGIQRVLATILISAKSALGLRLKKSEPAVHAHGIGHIDSHRFHHAQHELLPTNDLWESWLKAS